MLMNEVIIPLSIIVASILLVFGLRSLPKSNGDAAMSLKADITEMTNQLERLREGMRTQLDQKLDSNQQSMARQLAASTQLIKDVTERLTKLDETNKRVVDVADELKTLQNVLQSPKQRGVLGEYYLDSVLKNVLPPTGYQLQYRFKDGEIVDAVIFLDKGRVLPIDSKFSLENYNRMVGENDKQKREIFAKAFKQDLKGRIDETAKYIRPNEGTLEHAFMFIPSEAIYYDLLINKVGSANASERDLIEYAFVDKKVIIVGPSTLLSYLQTVMQGLRSLQIEETAKEIQKRVAMLGTHIRTYEDHMQRLGNSLGATVNHYNRAHKELAKIDKDVVKIADTSPSVEALVLNRPNESDEVL